MSEVIPLFGSEAENLQQGVLYKSHILKRRIIHSLSIDPVLTFSELSDDLGVSTPTIAKLMAELMASGYVQDMGKIETSGGRRPASFSLVDNAGYFLGVEVGADCLRFAMVDFNQNIVNTHIVEAFDTSNTPETLTHIIEAIETVITKFKVDKASILGQGISVRGRVDSVAGQSHNFLNFSEEPLAKVITNRSGIYTIVENDTRAVAYAEYMFSGSDRSLSTLFINIGRGVGVGIITSGELYYGKSGFAGEFGHIPFFDNQTICHCGKKGCLETEASGAALERAFQENLQAGGSSILSDRFKAGEYIKYMDIVEAAAADDVLSIELIGCLGDKLGRGIGVLINLFNPDTVILGGPLSRAGDYLMLPIRTALAKYTLSLVNNDTTLKISKQGDMGVAIGSSLLTRSHILSY